jgi:thiol-disulfide isomerase/thioredoxin
MNKVVKRVYSGIFWLGIVALLSIQAPRWWKLHQMEGQRVTTTTSGAPGSIDAMLLEPTDKVLLFWASWCGPCTVELSRFAAAVNEGKLKADRVIAVSMDDDNAAYEQAIKQREYPFRTYLDRSGLARRLGVRLTPTVLHVSKDGTVEYASSGMSFVGTWRARWFLRDSG